MFFKNPCKVFSCLAIIAALALIVACRTIPVAEREPMRQEIIELGNETIEKLTVQRPELQEKLDDSPGYFVGRLSGVKAPVLGFGKGIGVLHDTKQETRTYMNVKRFDLGLGLGTGQYRVLALFDNREEMEKFRSGKWTGGLGAESAAGEKASVAVSQADDELTLLLLPETGAALIATARLVKLSVNEDLTDTGVAQVSIPNTGFDTTDRQGDDAPRKWDRKLPFLAQQVVDKGYDLPLPYGIGLTYANVDQEMLLDKLQVGINGRDKEPFEFVAFENASSQSDSFNLKVDAWLFPFMNVYALVGKIEGKAPMDVLLDGNDMLTHLGIDCTGFPPNPLCAILEDETYVLPIEADYSGISYGVGTVFAGGWNNWFVTLPLSFTYADMEGKDTEGIATTVTPRFGRVFNAGNYGNFALYAGGNYLNTELTITGTVVDPTNTLEIDYTIDQDNKDKWNIVTGANWDINKRWSIAAEYNGYIGSREAIIISIGTRF